MIAGKSFATPFFTRLNVDKHLAVRGKVLSHAIGMAILIEILLDRHWRFPVPFPLTRPTDLPIFLVALWLILDRRGRIGTVRISVIDYLFLGFVALQAFSYVYADLFLIRFGGFRNYMDYSMLQLKPYLYFLVVREGLNRRGFEPKVVIYWLLGALSASALLGLAQAMDAFGARRWSYTFYNQMLDERRMLGPSAPWQAKGVTPHANNLAHTMWLGLAILAGFAWNRKLKPWELAIGALLLAALVATYSRSGVVTVTAMAGGLVLFLFVRKQYKLAALTLGVCTGLAMLGISAVYAFNVERLKIIVEGEGAVSRHEELGSFKLRMHNAVKAVNTGFKSPIFGTSPVGSLINNQNAVTYNNYAFEGRLDNTYSLAWVNYGLIGVAFMIGFIWTMLRTIGKSWSHSPFAISIFLIGVGYLVHFNTENLLFINTMMMPGILLAIVGPGKASKQ